MNLQHYRQGSAAFGLRDNCIYMARDGTIRPYAKTAAFLMTSGDSAELKDGRTLALYGSFEF
jgi:hypothetical protein